MTYRKRYKYTGFVYGEGRRDIKFLNELLSHEKFEEHHAEKWWFDYGNFHGSSAFDIIQGCKNEIQTKKFDLVLCFIDLDDLKTDYPSDWQEKKAEIEQMYENIEVVWFKDNLEDELAIVLGEEKSKHKLNKQARNNIDLFVNTKLWIRVKKIIKNKEEELDKQPE